MVWIIIEIEKASMGSSFDCGEEEGDVYEIIDFIEGIDYATKIQLQVLEEIIMIYNCV